MTIGIPWVASFAACTAGVRFATMMSTFSWTSSKARARAWSGCPLQLATRREWSVPPRTHDREDPVGTPPARRLVISGERQDADARHLPACCRVSATVATESSSDHCSEPDDRTRQGISRWWTIHVPDALPRGPRAGRAVGQRIREAAGEPVLHANERLTASGATR